MPIQPINFPMPSFEQNNPMLAGAKYGMGLVVQNQDMLSKMLAQKKSQAELPYAGPLQAANVMSKSAYAQWAPIQPLAQLLSNPAVWGTLPKDQLQNMTMILSKALQAPLAYNQLLSQSRAGQPSSGNNYLKELLQQQPQQPSPMMAPSGNQMQSPPSENQIQPSPNGDVTEGDGLPPTNFNRNAAAFTIPGSSGGANPLAYGKAQEAGLSTSSTAEAAAQQEMFKDMFKSAYSSGEESQNNINYINEFSNAYDKLSPYERGPAAGRLPAFTSSAQTADRSSAALADSVARAQQEGHITQSDRTTYLSMKAGRFMTPEAKKDAVNFIKGMNERIQERLPFLVEAQKVTYKGNKLSPQEINAIWLKYINQKPFFDSRSGEINRNNLESWPKYLAPSNVEKSLTPKKKEENSVYKNELYKNINKETKSAIKKEGEKFKNSTIHMISPTGEEYDVPQGKAQVFIENGFKRK